MFYESSIGDEQIYGHQVGDAQMNSFFSMILPILIITNAFSIPLLLTLIFISAISFFFYHKLDIDMETMFKNPPKYLFLFMGFAFMYALLITEAEALTIVDAPELHNLLVLLSTVLFWIFVFLGFVFMIKTVQYLHKKSKEKK